MKKYLLVIDLQRQFKEREMEMYDKCLNYIREHRTNYDAVIASVFSQTVDGAKNHHFTNNLGWNKCLGCDGRDLEFNPTFIIRKNTYSVDIPEMRLQRWFDPDCEIDVIGRDMGGCVLATCFSLWDMEMKFHILKDYVYVTAKGINHDELEKLMIWNFGEIYVK